MHRLVNPPPEKHKEGHPEERELNAEIDSASLGEFRWYQSFEPEDVVDHGAREVDDSDNTVRREGDDRE